MLKAKKLLFSALLGTLSFVGYTQMPSTDLFMFDLKSKIDNNGFEIENARLLSQFNAGGYTNQPSFMNDDEVYVSVRKTGQNQNDIFSIHIQDFTIRQVTDTPQSEYSPTLTLDRNSYACVREIIGSSIDQKLFVYPLNQSTGGKNLLAQVQNVGYFAFTHPDEVALFLVDNISKLAVAKPSKDEVSFLSSNIGRCLRTTEDGSLLYVHKYTDSFWYLKKYDLANRRASIITQSIANREDFCVLPDGRILMGDGSKLFIHSGEEGTNWQLVADLSEFGLTNITRMSINNRYQLVLVNQP